MNHKKLQEAIIFLIYNDSTATAAFTHSPDLEDKTAEQKSQVMSNFHL